MNKNINFVSIFKKANIASITVFILSIIFIFFKGLNYGIDFKGGTLIELRSSDKKINVSSLRDNLNQLNLGELHAKISKFKKTGGVSENSRNMH